MNLLNSAVLMLMAPSFATDSKPPAEIARTVTLQEDFKYPDGRTEPLRHIVNAVRADGAVVTIRTQGGADDPDSKHELRSVLLPDGRQIFIRGELGIKTTFYQVAPGAELGLRRRYRDQGTDCMKARPGARLTERAEVFVARETLAGLEVIHTRTPVEPASEYWYAPKLGCEVVRQVERARDPEGRYVGTYLQTLKSFTLGDPAPALFRDPTELEEVAPSVASARLAAARGTQSSRANMPGAQVVEGRYFQHRP